MPVLYSSAYARPDCRCHREVAERGAMDSRRLDRRGWRDWRRGDPTLIKGLWKSKGPLDSLGKAEVYIFLALLIGFVTVVVGCWLSDNCWSPEPEGVVTLA